MKIPQRINALAVLLALAALTGCQRQESAAGSQPPVTGEDVKESITNAAAVTRQYAYEAKDQAVQAVQKELTEMDAKIDALAKKSANYTNKAKDKAEDALAKLRRQRAVAAKKLDALKNATKASWQEVKSGCDQAWQQLEDTYDQVKDEFKS